jgi:hypothetical protein
MSPQEIEDLQDRLGQNVILREDGTRPLKSIGKLLSTPLRSFLRKIYVFWIDVFNIDGRTMFDAAEVISLGGCLVRFCRSRGQDAFIGIGMFLSTGDNGS